MNKRLFFCLIIVILFSVGCHNQPDYSTPISNPSSVLPEPIAPSTSDFRVQTGTDITPTPTEFSFKNLKQFILDYDDDRFLCKREGSTTGTTTYFEYNIKTGEETEIVQVTDTTLGSGDIILTDDMTLFYAGAVGEDENQSSLIKVDLVNRTEETLLSFTGWPPFQYLRLIDNNTLLIFRPIRIENAETEKYCYNIERYTLDNKTKKLLVQVPDSTKGFISCYDYADGIIYAYHGDITEDGSAQYYIQTYDTHGNPLHRYNTDDLSSHFAMSQDGEHVMQMTVFKDYFLFKTNMNIYYLLKADANHSLNFVDLPSNGDRYLYYYPAARLTDRIGVLYDESTHTVYRYDTKEECFVQQQVKLDVFQDYNKYIALIKEKSDGSLFMNVKDGADNDIDLYYILPPL